MSNISEDFDPNETLSESHWSYTHFDDHSNSSSSTNTEKTIIRQETLAGFIFTRPKHSNTHRQSCLIDKFSGSDESFPCYKSICTSTSSKSEDLLIQQETVDLETLIDTQKIQSQQTTTTNEKLNEPDKRNLHFKDKTSSISSDFEKMSMHEEPVIKSVFSNLIGRSDIQLKKPTYETSSDLTEVEI
ncbi:unnamed protein product [Rotaria sp. Silwood1]|nr:unnamed protein product [Rotaria sp. Silwood1]